MRTVERKVLRSIHGKTVHDSVKTEDLRHQSGVQDMERWVRERRYKHSKRMDDGRLVKNVKQKNPVWKRTQERTPNRWRECCRSSPGKEHAVVNICDYIRKEERR